MLALPGRHPAHVSDHQMIVRNTEFTAQGSAVKTGPKDVGIHAVKNYRNARLQSRRQLISDRLPVDNNARGKKSRRRPKSPPVNSEAALGNKVLHVPNAGNA